MAEWQQSTITRAGHVLMEHAIDGSGITVTRAEGGSTVCPAEELTEQIGISAPKIPINIVKTEDTETGKVIRLRITNTGLQKGYFLRQIGIFAKIGGNEILFSISQADVGEYIPNENELPNFYTEIEFMYVIGSAKELKVITSGNLYATLDELNSIKSSLENGIETHTHKAASTSASGFMSASDKSKLDNIPAGGNTYTHPTGDGNLHVPATGTGNSGKVLTAGGSAGSVKWETLSIEASNMTPKKNGLGAQGSEKKYARADHSHPLELNGVLPIESGGTGNSTGKATTAIRLETPRLINGIAFDGSKDITIPINGSILPSSLNTKKLFATDGVTDYNYILDIDCNTCDVIDYFILNKSNYNNLFFGIKLNLINLIPGFKKVIMLKTFSGSKTFKGRTLGSGMEINEQYDTAISGCDKWKVIENIVCWDNTSGERGVIHALGAILSDTIQSLPHQKKDWGGYYLKQDGSSNYYDFAGRYRNQIRKPNRAIEYERGYGNALGLHGGEKSIDALYKLTFEYLSVQDKFLTIDLLQNSITTNRYPKADT